MRYGVLCDIACAVRDGRPIDVTMGHVNIIWQGDAASQSLRALGHCTRPTAPLNVSGPDVLAVRALAEAVGRALGKAPRIVGAEADTAWIADTSQAVRLFGAPEVSLSRLIAWTADWVGRDMPTLGKPTHFEVRSGEF